MSTSTTSIANDDHSGAEETQSAFGPIGTLFSPQIGALFSGISSPPINIQTFPFSMNLESPAVGVNSFELPNTSIDNNQNQIPIQMNMNMNMNMDMNMDMNMMNNYDLNSMYNQFDWNNLNIMNFDLMNNNNNYHNLINTQLSELTQHNIPSLPPNIINDSQIQTTKKRQRKRKIKTEDADYQPNEPQIKKQKKRGRGRPKKIITTIIKEEENGEENDFDFKQLLNENTSNHLNSNLEPTFIGIKNDHGDIKISIPPQNPIKYEIYGHACTEKIEDILQPKKRTRYVRGLNDNEKKDRRREQNRNAAARSRARKNAMISKVIQLHQENLALRAYVSTNIKEKEELNKKKLTLEEKLKEINIKKTQINQNTDSKQIKSVLEE